MDGSACSTGWLAIRPRLPVPATEAAFGFLDARTGWEWNLFGRKRPWSGRIPRSPGPMSDDDFLGRFLGEPPVSVPPLGEEGMAPTEPCTRKEATDDLDL